MSRQRTPPWGLFGGQSGDKAKAFVKQHAEDEGVWLTKKPNYPLNAGGSVTFYTAGGGGYGPASERPGQLIERDKKFGYVSGSKRN